MNNKSNGKKCYNNEYESIKDKNCNFDFDFDIDIDIDEADEYSIKEMKNNDNEDCEAGYEKGFKDGYEKAKQEVLVYMKKNKCCIKCKHSCKLRRTNINKNFHKMIRCI